MLAGEKLDQIKQLFLSETAKAGNPTGMALFIRHESEGRLHCEVKVYFPPTTANLAKSVNAIPCAQPYRENLGLLIGTEESVL